MKITAVESIPVDRYLFAKVHTDSGLTGVGESGAWGFLEASQAAIDKLGRYLVGEDPLRIEHHWQYMYRFSHFRGAAIMGAISALDIALWDIAGKHFGVPVYQLMGGKTRDRARVYYHVFGDTREKLVQGVKDAKKAGFTAVGHLTPFLDEPTEVPFFKTHADKMRDAIEAVAAYREAAGDDVDLCIEIHRRLTPAEAVTLAKGIEPFHPLLLRGPHPARQLRRYGARGPEHLDPHSNRRALPHGARVPDAAQPGRRAVRPSRTSAWQAGSHTARRSRLSRRRTTLALCPTTRSARSAPRPASS